MNIFGIGGAELVLIILIMMVVAGPKRMVRWAYIIGQWIGQFRLMWEEAVDMMQKEVDAAGMDVQIPKDLPTRQNVTRMIEQAAKPYADPVQKTVDELRQPLQQVVEESNAALKSTEKEARQAVSGDLGAWSTPEDTPATAEELPQKTTPPNTFGSWGNPQTAADRSQENGAHS